MKKTVKNYSLTATQKKVEELKEIAERYSDVKNYIFQKYGSLSGLQYLNYPREIRDEWVSDPDAICLLEQFGLQARQWKMAFDEAFSNIKTNWSLCFNKVRKAIYRNENLTKDEKEYCYYLLSAYPLLYKAITFQDFERPKKISELVVDTDKVHRWLKRTIRKYQNNRPIDKKRRTFTLDSSMYDYFEDENGTLWFGIMSLTPKKRIHIPLTSNTKFKGNITVVVYMEAGENRIEIHHAKEIKPVNIWSEEKIIGIDKGYTEVISTSEDEDDKYGSEFGDMLKEKSDRVSEKNKKRNKLFALARKNEEKNTKDGKKKNENIKKYNLGQKKVNRQKSKDHANIESYVNNSLNNFFENDKPSEIVVENLNFNSWSKKLPKKVKRYFSSWLRGLLRERIDYKAMVNGVHQTTVNPAYTSQLCPICGYLDSKNRKGDKFKCLSCGVEMDADYCGSINLKNRKDDKEITLWTPYKKVKEILLDRFAVGGSNSKSKFATGSTKTLDTSIQIEVNQRAKYPKNYTNLS